MGHVADGSIRRDGLLVCAELVLLDGTALERVDAGEDVELSCGYVCDYIAEPGVTPEGFKFDGRQTNIKYNHVALLKAGEGRAGREARLRLDAADAAVCDEFEVRMHLVLPMRFEPIWIV